MKHTERDSIPNTPRNLRLDQGMSGRAVAEIAGWTPSVQSRFERVRTGRKAVTYAMFYAAIGREDLAEPLIPLLSSPEQSRVNKVRERRNRLASDA